MSAKVPWHVRVRSSPLTAAGWLVLVLAVFAFVVLAWRDYTEHYAAVDRERRAAGEFWRHNCEDRFRRERVGMDTFQCDLKESKSRMQPATRALVLTVESWVPCGGGGCRETLEAFGNRLLYLVALAIVIVLLNLCLCGNYIQAGRREYEALHMLPMTSAAAAAVSPAYRTVKQE